MFTPPQMLHAERNDYYVYLVENVRHRDPTQVQIRALHGEQLLRVMTDPGVQIQRYSVPLRRAEYDKMPRLDQLP